MIANQRAAIGLSSSRPGQDVRAAVPDARPEPREHDVERFSHHRHRAISRLRSSSASGSELRVDGTLGSDPGVAIELYQPIGRRRCSSLPTPASRRRPSTSSSDDVVIARYGRPCRRLGLNAGRQSRRAQRPPRRRLHRALDSTSGRAGDPACRSCAAQETGAELTWRYDTQDSPVSRRAACIRMR